MTLVAAAGLPQLAKYELLEEIGHGGMATVYRARDPRLGREVAVKVIHKHLRENREVATRFVAEAKAAAKLRHRGIVEVYDVSSEEDEGERYLVVELLRGATLRKILHEHREMPAEVGAAIVLELCDALEHAHAGSVIHRDVKPENVLVELPSDRAACAAPRRGASSRGHKAADASGERMASDTVLPPSDPRSSGRRGVRTPEEEVVIKLTDFGIAKILDAQGVTSTGQVLGSPAHMAPEQIEGGEVDPRTDVFALGVLMYECMVGHLPFEGKNPAQVLRRVLDGSFAPADRERATVGGRWAKVLARALAREAPARTPSPGALAEEIGDELSALGIDDPRGEIGAYFLDPAEHTADLHKRLVPRLVARGEAARRAGDVPGAADDFNRAAALAPGDQAILKRVTSLTSSASRRVLARRVGAIALGSGLLAVATFGIVRAVRTRADVAPVIAEGSGTAVAIAPEPSGDPTTRVVTPLPTGGPAVSASASATPRVTLPRISGPPLPPPGPAPAGKRNVKFNVMPMGARLTLNGAEIQWFREVVSLAPGPHAVQLAGAPTSKCCKARSDVAQVKPPDPEKPDAVQVISFRLELNASTIRLAGAPTNASFSCGGLGVGGLAGQTLTTTLPSAEWQGRCTFTPPDGGDAKKASVTLRAGEPNVVPWPP